MRPSSRSAARFRILPGAGNNQHFRVLDLIPVENEDSPYVGLLLVEAG